MKKIEFENGSEVYYQNREYTVFRAVNINEIAIKDPLTKEQLIVPISKLSSTKRQEEPHPLEEYSKTDWNAAKNKYEIIKDLVFKKRSLEVIKEVASKAGVSKTTIYEWLKKYEQTSDISSLISQTSKRGKKGSRLDTDTENVVSQIINEMYLNKQRYSFQRIYNKIKMECKKLGLSAPHSNTVRNRIDNIDPRESLKKRHGHRAYKQQFVEASGEYPEGNYPFEVIQIDHTPMDIIVVDKVYRKPLKRPYLTVAIDVYSRMIAGIYISLEGPGYYNVSQCLFSVFSKKDDLLQKYEIPGEWNIYGIPRVIHVDNGADLVSYDMQRVCDEFGITLFKRPVGRPEFAGSIERALKTINSQTHDLPGTTKSNIQAKGDYDSQKYATFTIEELTKWILIHIVTTYHKNYHSGIGMSPEAKYLQGIFGDDENPGTGTLPPISDHLDDVRIALLPAFFRTVQREGIALDGIYYYSDVLRYWINKTDDKGEKIKHKIKRDPYNIKTIYFYDPELKKYFDIPSRKLSAPSMTLWDMYAAKRHLKEKHKLNYNEDDIFAAYQMQEKIEEQSAQLTRESKRKRARASNENLVQKTNTIPEQQNYESLFANIKIFDVFTRDES
ncbi:MAG: DDE-type integrase/transposase/recombinase [Thiovulaceae bacterium]|nr:DDE-type integrase/transposase/recombinase [Sulfurimonadaceae bacterium]